MISSIILKSNLNGVFTIQNLIVVLLLTISYCSQCESIYILDEMHPLVISEGKSENSSSHFGLTVSLSAGPSGGFVPDKPTGWVFIGAPKSNLSGMAIDEPGVMWRCSLGRSLKSNSIDTCETINIDPIPRTSNGAAGRRDKSPRYEDEGNGWIGGSLQIKNDRLVVCAPRYTRGERSYINGICYWLPDDVPNKVSYRPDKPLDIKTYSHRLNPFFNYTDAMFDQTFDFINQNNEKDGGYELGVGQVGFSVHILINSSQGKELLLGAIVRYRDNPTARQRSNFRQNRILNESYFSEYVIGYRGLKSQAANNHWYDYFGYEVTSGKFFNTAEILYCAGAPRGNRLTGEVVIFNIPVTNNSFKSQVESILTIHPPSKYDALGWYFGSVLHAVDLDDDGIDELIVGAPLCTLGKFRAKRSAVFIDEEMKFEGDHGCVLIYTFKSRNLTSASVIILPEQILNGSFIPESRFGSAISHIRRKNMATNAHETFLVIGSPYENSGTGAIYIYNTVQSNDRHIHLEMSQKIFANEIKETIYTFGSSISYPQDVDGNGTPDLAIGAYESNQVVILRTRPKISLTGNISAVNANEKGKYSRDVQNIRYRSCVIVQRESGVGDPTIDVWTKITIDHRLLIQKVPHIITNTDDNLTFIFKQSVTLNEIGTAKGCSEFGATIANQKQFAEDDADLDPFTMIQTIWYNATSGSDAMKLQVVEYMLPESNSGQVRPSGTDFSSFQTNLPYPVDPVNNQFDLEISPNDCKMDPCQPVLTIKHQYFHVADSNRTMPITEMSVGDYADIIYQMIIFNSGETATPPTRINFAWDATTGIVPSVDDNFLMSKNCKTETVYEKIVYNCNFTKSIRRSFSKTIEIRLSLSKFYAKQSMDNFTIKWHIKPSGGFNKEQFNSTTLLLKAESKIIIVGSSGNETFQNPFEYNCSEIAFGSTRSSESLHSKNKMQIQKQILYGKWRQTYTIRVLGKTGVQNVKLNFTIPWGVKLTPDAPTTTPLILTHFDNRDQGNVVCNPRTEGDHLYFIDEQSVDVDNESQFGNGKDFSDIIPTPALKKKRRDLSEASTPDFDNSNTALMINNKRNKFPVTEDVLKIDCDEDDASHQFTCIHIDCVISKLSVNRLMEVSFEFYIIKDKIDKLRTSLNKPEVLVETKGQATIFEGVHYENWFIDEDVAQTKFVKLETWIAHWVFIVSIISGLIILTLIMIGLHKCGFFKRETKEQLQLLKAQARRGTIMMSSMFPEEVQSLVDTGGTGMDQNQESINKTPSPNF